MTALSLHHAVVDLHCFGGFVVAHMFGLARTTNDIDFISPAPNHWRTQLVEIAKVRGFISGTVSKRMKRSVESAKGRAGPACLQGCRPAERPAHRRRPLGWRLYHGNGRPQLAIWDRGDYPRSAVTKLASDPAALLLAVHYTVRWFFIDGIA